jgi:hypothetical protein
MDNPEQPKGYYISSTLGEVHHSIHMSSIEHYNDCVHVSNVMHLNFINAETLLNGKLKEAIQYVKDFDDQAMQVHKTERKVYVDALHSLESAIWKMHHAKGQVNEAVDAATNAMYMCEIASVLANNIKR